MKRSVAVFFALLLMLLLCSCGTKTTYDYDTSYPSGTLPNEQLDFSGSASIAPTPYQMQFSTSAPQTDVPSSVSNLQPAGAADPSSVEPTQTQTAADPSSQGMTQPQTSAGTQTQGTAPILTTAEAQNQSTAQTQTAGQSVQTPVQTVAPVRETAAPTAAPAQYVNEVTITKSPTSETVYAGGSALFIARAKNATSTNWIVVSPDAKTSYRIQDAPGTFTGLTVEGQGTSELRLSNIPTSMSGWRVQCYFNGEGGPKYTSGAYLTVLSGSGPSVSPGAGDAETKVSQLSVSTGQEMYRRAVGYGYTSVTDISNYSYSSGQATFSMTFTSASGYKVIGQFRASCYASGNTTIEPLYVYVYDSAGTSIQANNMSGQTFDYFYSILDQYK